MVSFKNKTSQMFDVLKQNQKRQRLTMTAYQYESNQRFDSILKHLADDRKMTNEHMAKDRRLMHEVIQKITDQS